MKLLIINGNPKMDGLCATMLQKATEGACAGKADVVMLSTSGINGCQVCEDGWGICKIEHRCIQKDDVFSKLHEEVRKADAFCFITPVYWGEVSETLKSFLDRVRRCEFGQTGAFSNKPILLIASPGGSGNGLLTCLEQMDRFCRHVGAQIFDYIGVNRWNSDYKGKAIYEAMYHMAQGRKAGETV